MFVCGRWCKTVLVPLVLSYFVRSSIGCFVKLRDVAKSLKNRLLLDGMKASHPDGVVTIRHANLAPARTAPRLGRECLVGQFVRSNRVCSSQAHTGVYCCETTFQHYPTGKSARLAYQFVVFVRGISLTRTPTFLKGAYDWKNVRY